MNSEEARMFENLAVPVVDHDVEIPLPNGNGNLLSLPIVSFYVSYKGENGDMVFGRKATNPRPHDPNEHSGRTPALDGTSQKSTALVLGRQHYACQ